MRGRRRRRWLRCRRGEAAGRKERKYAQADALYSDRAALLAGVALGSL